MVDFTIGPASLYDRHDGHDVDPRFETMLRDHIAAATPVLEAVHAHGWRDLVLDPGIDCEVPTLPRSVDVIGVVDFDLLGEVRIFARFMGEGLAAEERDVHVAMGASSLHQCAFTLVVADSFTHPVRYVGRMRCLRPAQTPVKSLPTLPVQEPA